MAHDVFICHSSRDKEIADAVCRTLEAQGLTCWIAPRDIQAGSSYAESIIGGISNARAMVLVFSATANASQQVEREIERAVHHNIPLVPFRIENIKPERALEYFLSTPHWLDAYSPPMEPHLARLASQVTALLGKPPAARPAPPPVAPVMAAAPLAAAAPAAAHAVPPPHRSNNTLVLVAGGVVAFSVLVLAAVIFMKPFGGAAAPALAANAAEPAANAASSATVAGAAPANAAPAPAADTTASAAPGSAAPAAPAPTAAAAPPAALPTAAAASQPVQLAAGECRTADPTSTPLNIRSRPGGDIVGAIDNGAVVRVTDHQRGMQGRLWALIQPVSGSAMSGWVFENFLDCPGGDAGAEDAPPATDRPRGPGPRRRELMGAGPG